jgi:hypothetical protein
MLSGAPDRSLALRILGLGCNERRGSNEDPWVLSTASVTLERRVNRGITETKKQEKECEAKYAPKEGCWYMESGNGMLFYDKSGRHSLTITS